MAKGSVNKVIIMGRLGKDPELIQTQGGGQIAKLSVATTELGRKDANTGQRGEDETEWHRVVVFGKSAENAAKYLQKGAQVYIEGRLKTSKYQDSNGIDKYSTDIICNEMQFMGGGQQQQQPQQQQGGYQQPQQQAQRPQQQQRPQQSAPQPAQQAGGFDDFEDDGAPF